jgi:hypothetical protein
MDTDGGITPQHYAFLISEAEFDEIFGRIRDRKLPYWADPGAAALTAGKAALGLGCVKRPSGNTVRQCPPRLPSAAGELCSGHVGGRTFASCSVGGADLGDWLVRNGFALDWPQYSKGKYGDAQRGAERAGRGIWAGSYVESIRLGGRPNDCSDDANAHP